MTAGALLRWPVEPRVSVGPLRLGMTRAEVRQAMAALTDEAPTQFERDPGRPLDHFAAVGVQVHYDDDRCIAVEVADPVQPVLAGHALVGRPLAEVAEVVGRLDPTAEVQPDGLRSVPLGLALYAPAAAKERDGPVEGVLVTTDRQLREPGPPPSPAAVAVLDPGVPFATVDAAARAVGFAGGPVTAYAPLVAGEPELAEWAREDALVTYTFDPVVTLRVLRASTRPDDSRWQRLIERLPLLADGDVSSGLFARDEETLVRSVLAAAALGLRDLAPRIDQLRRHPSAAVAAAAERAGRGLAGTAG